MFKDNNSEQIKDKIRNEEEQEGVRKKERMRDWENKRKKEREKIERKKERFWKIASPRKIKNEGVWKKRTNNTVNPLMQFIWLSTNSRSDVKRQDWGKSKKRKKSFFQYIAPLHDFQLNGREMWKCSYKCVDTKDEREKKTEYFQSLSF